MHFDQINALIKIKQLTDPKRLNGSVFKTLSKHPLTKHVQIWSMKGGRLVHVLQQTSWSADNDIGPRDFFWFIFQILKSLKKNNKLLHHKSLDKKYARTILITKDKRDTPFHQLQDQQKIHGSCRPSSTPQRSGRPALGWERWWEHRGHPSQSTVHDTSTPKPGDSHSALERLQNDVWIWKNTED